MIKCTQCQTCPPVEYPKCTQCQTCPPVEYPQRSPLKHLTLLKMQILPLRPPQHYLLEYNSSACVLVCVLRMYVSMYVCMYVHTYVCMYVCTYVCMYVCTYVPCIHLLPTDYLSTHILANLLLFWIPYILPFTSGWLQWVPCVLSHSNEVQCPRTHAVCCPGGCYSLRDSQWCYQFQGGRKGSHGKPTLCGLCTKS